MIDIIVLDTIDRIYLMCILEIQYFQIRLYYDDDEVA